MTTPTGLVKSMGSRKRTTRTRQRIFRNTDIHKPPYSCRSRQQSSQKLQLRSHGSPHDSHFCPVPLHSRQRDPIRSHSPVPPHDGHCIVTSTSSVAPHPTRPQGQTRRAFRCPAYSRGWGKWPLSLAQPNVQPPVTSKPKGENVSRIGFPSARERVRPVRLQGPPGGRGYVSRPPGVTPQPGRYHARSVRPRSATLRCVSLPASLKRQPPVHAATPVPVRAARGSYPLT